ncbi:MAG: hypothetical protein CL917_05065 [Deltaproteobacteria bacterium]|nr:hypothetical protein [Deltaproteobacteria bacterium]
MVKRLGKTVFSTLCVLLMASCSGGSDSSDSQSDAQSSSPTICSTANRGNCECNNEEGFTTWTWQVAGQQRCATTYVPPSVEGALPVLISNDTYSRNRLGECRTGSEMVSAADRFGFAGLCTTSADGNWTFGNDGVVNASQPTPCSTEDSKDIIYMNGVFDIIDRLGESGEVKSDKIYSWGFSQNAMFTAYTAFCYPDRITAFWQGGSGLYVEGETNALPLMEGACRHSDFVEYGQQCAIESPCLECEYFPVYPVPTTPPMAGCIMAYEDDSLVETTAPMANLMTTEGHDATLLHFPDIGRGHTEPLMSWDWIVGCMGVVESCSPACSAAVTTCVEDMAGSTPQTREDDYFACTNAEPADCAAGCAPTLDMLRLVERPCVVDGLCDNGETSQTCPSDCSL